MDFNLDLVYAELADLHPIARFASHSALDLDRIEVFSPASRPRPGTLFIADICTCMQQKHDIAHFGSFVVLGYDADANHLSLEGLNAIFVPATEGLPSPHELLGRLLEYRMRLDGWAEGILAAMARDAPLQEVFDVAATMFSNPIMLSDGALYFVLTAGTIPEGFHDRLWTPAIETGMCPSELYAEAWAACSGNAFGRRDAYLVPNAMDDGRTYLVRNLVCGDAYHGCFELVDVNAPFTPADLALADRFGDMLNMILPRKTYPQIAEASLGPLRDLLAGSAVRPRALECGLAELGWKVDDSYFVACFSGADEEDEAQSAQTLRRISRRYPLARFYREGASHLMIARNDDYPLSVMHDRHARCDAAPDTEPRFLAGFSSLFMDFSLVRTAADQAAFAYRHADKGAYAGRFGISRTCFYDDCWFEDAAERLALDDGVHQLLDRSIVELALFDARGGADYVPTALAYLEHGCSAVRTAEALFIHRNTLAYRLKRIKAISGIDLEDLAEKGFDPLRIHLSLRLLSKTGTTPSPFPSSDADRK